MDKARRRHTQVRRAPIDVDIPEFVVFEPAATTRCKSGDALLFDDGHGRHLKRPMSFTGLFAGAVGRSGVPWVTIDDLRHSAASTAISAGVNVKALQRMLGHASAAMTLDVYSDVFDDDLDAVEIAPNQARSSANVAKPWAQAPEQDPAG
ncbi:tyrosine-type recombinase/integrase [Gordonia rhizosphera]|nr:tyrosine-type recombinase/integrase [Gordonia rhizosphera]